MKCLYCNQDTSDRHQKKYCSEQCRNQAWRGQHPKKTEYKNKCSYCNQEMSERYQKKYCSGFCRSKAWHELHHQHKTDLYFNCLHCNKAISPKRGKRFCSSKCRSKARHARYTKTIFCPQCGIEVSRRYKKKFCSIECRKEARAKWKRKIRLCKHCGRQLPPNRRFIAYCDSSCKYQAWRLKHGNRKKAYRKKPILTNCYCGKPIIHPRRTYCSDECWKVVADKTKQAWRDRNPEKVKKYKLKSYHKKEKECPGYHAKKRLELHNKKWAEDPAYREKKRAEWRIRDAKQRARKMETQYGLLQLIIGDIAADKPQD